MIPTWSFESPVALASPGLPLLLRTHLNPSTCALTMQSCRYRKTTKEAFLFLAQPTMWHCTGHLPLQRNKMPSNNYPETDRFLERRTHLKINTQKIPAKREKDCTGTRSSPHTLQVQNGGQLIWYNDNCIISMPGFVWVFSLKKQQKLFVIQLS